MNGLHRSELNSPRNDRKESERLISLEEAAALLELDEGDIKAFVAEGKIPAYNIGGKFLRFRKGQVEALRSRLRMLKHQSVPIYHLTPPPEPGTRQKYSFFDRIRDFVYFNDFYILAFILIALLIAVIITKR
ncbi:MAG: helix-turn-helix domain-containing protein [Candidatus Omnitrophota bacterium]